MTTKTLKVETEFGTFTRITSASYKFLVVGAGRNAGHLAECREMMLKNGRTEAEAQAYVDEVLATGPRTTWSGSLAAAQKAAQTLAKTALTVRIIPVPEQ